MLLHESMTMKIHRVLTDATANTLRAIFEQDELPDKALEKTLRSHQKFGSRDRKFIAGAVYACVRNYRLYKACLPLNTQETSTYLDMIAVYMIHEGYEMNTAAIWGQPDTEAIKQQLILNFPVIAEAAGWTTSGN